MQIEIFEKADYSSEHSDLDLMLDYTIQTLKNRGITVKRYDQAIEPEAFEDIKGYALPLIKLDGEILCAGAYDFTLLDKKTLSGNTCGQSCGGCGQKSGCSGCPGKAACPKLM